MKDEGKITKASFYSSSCWFSRRLKLTSPAALVKFYNFKNDDAPSAARREVS
jgi:hypothetical protein